MAAEAGKVIHLALAELAEEAQALEEVEQTITQQKELRQETEQMDLAAVAAVAEYRLLE